MKRYLALLIAFALVCPLMLPSIPCASATTSNLIDNYSVSFCGNSIIEYVTTSVNGVPILVTRTTYTNNTAIVNVVENGNTSTFSYFIDYNTLYQNLSQQQLTAATENINQRSGYVYTPMKSEVHTSYLKPKNLTIATVLGALSLVMSARGIPYSSLVAIAAMIVSGSGAPTETKLVTTMDWYFKTLDGEFISYYCEYTTKTYVLKDTGVWEYVGTESGTMESLTVW